MKKKLVIGLLIVTILGVAAGSHLFNQTSAQDPQKKADPEKKVEGDLFDLLKKSLEGKKDTPVVPAPFEAGLPPVKDDKVVPPISSTPSVAPPLAVPPVSDVNTSPRDPAPPLPAIGPNFAPTLAVPPVSDVKPASAQDAAPPTISPPFYPAKDAPVVEPTPVVPVSPSKAPMPPPGLAPSYPSSPSNVTPMPPGPSGGFAGDRKIPSTPLPQANSVPFAPFDKAPDPTRPSVDQKLPPTVQLAPAKTPIPEQLAAMKDCPWSLQVDMVEGKTVVTATVNKKHEFKIVCQSLDLQTGKSVLKAAGKVQITGDMMTGHCEHLSISLHEDRLLLEGKAEVSIQKVSTKVSSEASTSFELKGQTLDLRISDYTSAKLVQAGGLWSGGGVEAIPMRSTSPALPSTDGKKWTSYGTLRPAKLDLGGKEIAWSLQDREGKVITYLVARDGGTLRQYEGQTISVLGATEQIGGRPMLRVTHIALP